MTLNTADTGGERVARIPWDREHGLNADLDVDAQEKIRALAVKFWGYADSGLSNGFAMFEMLEIITEVSGLSPQHPVSILMRLAPGSFDPESLKRVYLAEDLYLSMLSLYQDLSQDYCPPAYDLKRDTLEGRQSEALEVHEAGEAGQGLYAKVGFKSGDLVFVTSGRMKVFCDPFESKAVEALSPDKGLGFQLRSRNPDVLFPNAICVDQRSLADMIWLRVENDVKANIWCDPSGKCPLRFLNHSCDPNLIRQGDGFSFQALRDIQPGEQLTVDYSTLEVNPDWEMVCKCGSTGCRGVVKSAQFLSDDLFRKYGASFPKFMWDLIKNARSDDDKSILREISNTRWMAGF